MFNTKGSGYYAGNSNHNDFINEISKMDVGDLILIIHQS